MKAHTPTELPIKTLDWRKFIKHIASANAELARFDGFLQSIPNATLLLSPLTTKEAVLSSKIEGTQATLEEVLQFEANPSQKTENYEDIREVLNYRKATIFAIEELKKLPLSTRLVRKIHEILLDGVRREGKDPGNFRTGQVFIGKQGLGVEHASYVPPEPQHLNELFSNLDKYINAYDEDDYLVQLAIVHAQFEMIHPFWDGNGRTGRILMPLFLYYKKVLSTPMFYLSEYLEINRDEYYECLQNISRDSDWESWIIFFLKGITEQSKKNSQKAQQIQDLYNQQKDKVEGIPTPRNVIKTLDFLFSKPIFSSSDFAQTTKIEKRTVFRILHFLETKGIISSNNKPKNKVYFFNQLLEIIA